MAKVRDVISVKGSAVYHIGPTATVYDAIQKMVECNVGALVVMRDGTPCGIITERDYLRRVALEGRTSKATRVEEIMSEKLASVGRDTELDDCMEIMTERRLRHLVVLDGGVLGGVVSIGDLVKWQVLEREAEVESLTNYIQGRA